MFDRRLRTTSAKVLDPLAARVPAALSARAISGIGLACGLGAAVAAATGATFVAVVLWLANRLADGLDGAVARRRARAGDAGGYLDIMADVVVYAAVVIGVAAGVDERATWIAAAVLVASFYVNTISWAYLAALLERRAAGVDRTGETTSVTMPAGLVEGAETIVWLTLLVAVPSLAPWWMGTMAAATFAGAALRVRAGVRELDRLDAGEGSAAVDADPDPDAGARRAVQRSRPAGRT